MASLHPEHGARFVLERLDVTPGAARYRVQVFGREPARWVGEATIARPAGTVSRDGPDGLPAWACTTLDGFLATLAKRHAEDGAFPAKLTRWRAPRT
ncbi:MAG: hypothetical protein ACFCGT_15935 [Sandaracinaceae bacterium]